MRVLVPYIKLKLLSHVIGGPHPFDRIRTDGGY